MRSVIDEIAAAEQRAEEIRLTAASDARDMMTKAREEAQHALAAVESSERELAQTESESARQEGERLSGEMIAKLEQETDQLCARAQSRLDTAVSYLVDKVIKTA